MAPIVVFRCSSALKRVLLLLYVLAASTTLPAQVAATLNAGVLNVGTPNGTALTNPYAVAVDGAGNVYISGNSRIVKIPPGGPGVVLNVGTPGGTGFLPSGVAVDGAGNVYFGDFNNQRIVEVPPGGPGTVLNVGSPGGRPLLNPFSVAVDGAGNVYISDSNQERILKVPPGGPATVFRSSPIVQNGVAVDGVGNVYIADRTNNQIVEVPPGGGSGTVLNVGTPGGTPLLSPFGMAVDAAGNLYIADTGNNRIVKVPPGGPGVVLDVGTPGGTPLGPVNAGLAVDGAGNLYFADTSNNRIVELAAAQNLGSAPVGATGVPITMSYTISGYSGNSYTPTFKMAFGADTTVSAPICTGGASPQTCTAQVMLKPTVPGAIKDAVQVLDPTGTTLLAQTLVYGTATGPLGVFQPGNASVLNVGTPNGTALTNPYAVAVDGAGNVYISGNSRIVKIPPGGPGVVLNVGTPGGTGFLPSGVAVDGAGNVYFGDFNNQRIVEVPPGGPGTVLNVGSPGGRPLLNPFSVAVDGAGNVYISDSNQERILKVPPGGPATVFRSSPIVQNGVAVDGVGNVYIADRTNNQIVEVPPGGGSGTVLNVGTPGGTPLLSPFGMAVDAAGNLYIADTGNNRIVKVPPGGPGVVLDVGTPGGTPLGPVNAGLAVDGAGNLYFADTSNNRIVELAQSAQPLSFTTTNVGSTSTDSPQTVSLLNIGNQPLGITALDTTTAGQTTTSFNLSGSTTTCTNSTSLAPGETCALGVQFAPVNVGPLTGTVNITDNNLNVEGVQQIPVSGAGVGVATTTLTASVNPQVQGLPVVFTAQVTPTPTNGPIPTGTVTFEEGTTVLSTGTLNSAGIATFTTSSLSVGTYTITAMYSGDPNYQSSTSSPLLQTIVASLPETIEPVGGNDQAAVYGTAFAQPLSVVVTLSNGNPAAGVAVTFVGTGLSFSSGGAVTTNSNGMASVTVTGAHAGGFVAAVMATGTPQTVNFALIVTPAPLTATANNATRPYGAVNPAFAGTVTGAVFGDTFSVSGSTTAVTSSSAGTYPITPIVTGTALVNYTLTKVNGVLTVTPVPLTVTANNATRPYGAGNPVFTGTVTGAVLGDTFTVSGSTTALINSPVGTYPITPTASGPTLTSYTVSKVNGILTVTQAAGSVSLMVSPNPVVSGSQVTLTATVASGQTGTVTFIDGTTVLGTAAISGTMARLVIPTLTPALHTLTAVYNGDANFASATSPPVILVVDVVILTPPAGPAKEGTPVTLTATVPVGATGTVTFYEGTTPIGTVTISSVTGLTNTGILVTLVTTSLAAGTQTITAVFSGDSNFPPSTSPPITVVVTPPPPDFALATSTGRQLIPPGASANFTIAVSSMSAPFINPVTMSATNLPPGATYTFTPAAVTPGAAGANSTFTVSVPPQSNMASRSRSLGPVAFALLLLPFAWLKRHRRNPQRLLLWILVALASFGAVSGCGEGGYFSQTEQTYTITVTGTSGTLVRSTTVTLTVE